MSPAELFAAADAVPCAHTRAAYRRLQQIEEKVLADMLTRQASLERHDAIFHTPLAVAYMAVFDTLLMS